MSDFQFKKGTKVEISIDEEGFRGAWFQGTVVKKNGRKVTVEYETLLADENDITPLREDLDLVQVRPIPPRETSRVYSLDEEVDAFHNDGWWEGVITQVLENGGLFSVYFRPNREQSDFKSSDLRLHREWVHGKWVPPLAKRQAVKSRARVNVNEWKEENNERKEEKVYSQGDLIEVSNDEAGFEGARFAATIIEVLGENNYLIEYKLLRTDDGLELVREKVDSLHITPCPPHIERIDKFKLYEEVDAVYNDGWWVGIISKIHDSKYTVFFKTTNEEIEFTHGDLRLHQDWIDGKWVSASQSLDLSH